MASSARCLSLFAFALALICSAAQAAEEQGARDLAYEDRIAQLERTVETLAGELDRVRKDSAVPEDPTLDERFSGLGPAASKVYGLASGLSIGGYGEANYSALVGDKQSGSNRADMLRAVLYFGYKFTDRIVFNSEIEIEHADEIFVEFAQLDFLLHDAANARTGLLLVPMGFLNELHEPPFFYGVKRPDTESVIIPSTWRENGVGLFGDVGELFQYKLYAVNGLDATGFTSSGLRGGRQKGSQALAEHIGFVARADFTPVPSFLLGASVYAGYSGQNQTVGGVRIPDAYTTIFDVHSQFRYRGLHLRGLFAMAFLDESNDLTLARLASDTSFSGVIAEEMLGGYAEVAYDVWDFFSESERTLEPFYRFEFTDTQWEVPSGFATDSTQRITSHTVGIQFEPVPNVVLKADYRNRDAREGGLADELNFGFGYVF